MQVLIDSFIYKDLQIYRGEWFSRLDMEENDIELELHHLSLLFYAMKRTQKVVRTHCYLTNLVAEFQ